MIFYLTPVLLSSIILISNILVMVHSRFYFNGLHPLLYLSLMRLQDATYHSQFIGCLIGLSCLSINRKNPQILCYICSPANKKKDVLAEVVEKQTKTTSNLNKTQSHKLDEEVKKNLVAQYGQESDEDL